MRTRDELDVFWSSLPAPPRDSGTLTHLVLRRGRGVHETVEATELSPEQGLHGDYWSRDDGDPLAQVTMMSVAVARAIRATADQPLHVAGDNLLVDLDLSEDALPAGRRLRVGDALLEVTSKPHLGCAVFRARFGADVLAWVNEKANRHLRLRGIHCRVVEAGSAAVGDAVRPLR